jgi:4a-hydroxytetrahydrobiopterin dehydratase
MEVLKKEDIEKALEHLDGWEYNEKSIQTTIEFKDFKEAFSAMTRIAFEAEAQQHHPEWTNVYNQVEISLSTHDAGGVTQKDIEMATTIETLLFS